MSVNAESDEKATIWKGKIDDFYENAAKLEEKANPNPRWNSYIESLFHNTFIDDFSHFSHFGAVW